MSQDRRTFLKTTGAAAAAVAMGAPFSQASAQENAGMDKTPVIPEYNPNFGVYDEWGPLKHCLVGTAETFRFPDNVDKGYEVVSPATLDFLRKGPGKLFKDVYPKEFDEFQSELDALADTIASHGIKVERPFKMTDAERTMVPPGEDGHPAPRQVRTDRFERLRTRCTSATMLRHREVPDSRVKRDASLLRLRKRARDTSCHTPDGDYRIQLMGPWSIPKATWIRGALLFWR